MSHAALLACREQVFQEIMKHPEEDLIRVKVKEVHTYSCYAPLSTKLDEYEQKPSVFDYRIRSKKGTGVGNPTESFKRQAMKTIMKKRKSRPRMKVMQGFLFF